MDNAIWLCPTCSVLVDRDPLRFPAHVLRDWKQQAEIYAFQKLNNTASAAKPEVMPEHPLDRFHQLLNKPEEWISVPGDRFYYYHCMASDYVISEGETVNEDFSAPWTKRFPDPYAWSINVNYLCRNTTVKSSLFVVVDGGRYTLPIPRTRITSSDDALKYVIDESSLEWKTALLFEQYLSDIKEQLRYAGVQVIGEGA